MDGRAPSAGLANHRAVSTSAQTDFSLHPIAAKILRGRRFRRPSELFHRLRTGIMTLDDRPVVVLLEKDRADVIAAPERCLPCSTAASADPRFVLCGWRRCSIGRCQYARMSSVVSSATTCATCRFIMSSSSRQHLPSPAKRELTEGCAIAASCCLRRRTYRIPSRAATQTRIVRMDDSRLND